MGLEEYAVDLLESDGFGLIADGFEERADAKIPCLANDAVGGTRDEVEGLVGESVVTEADAIELGKDEGLGVVGGEFLDDDGIGDAGLDVLVDGEVELVVIFQIIIDTDYRTGVIRNSSYSRSVIVKSSR